MASEVPDTHAFIRPATPADAPGITACVHAAYTPWIPIIGRPPRPMQMDYAEVIAANQVVVAEHAGQVCGVLVLSMTDEGFTIDNVAVLPSHHGQGLGRALLVWAEQEARRQGHDAIHLYTNELMAGNIALYARVGYVEYDRRQGQGFRRVFMRKTLR